jgi:hypothetical protein
MLSQAREFAGRLSFCARYCLSYGASSIPLILGFVLIPGILPLVALVQPFPVRQLADPGLLFPHHSLLVWYSFASFLVVLLFRFLARNTRHVQTV